MKIKIFVVCAASIAMIAVMAATFNSATPSSEAESVGNQRLSFISFEDLLDAIEQVESGGDPNAIGDNGDAVGSFQIWKIYVDDVNRITGRHRYSYSDRNSPYLSRSMVGAYIGHYATEKRLKRIPTFEDIARIHNGGPNGYKKECTKKYWKKIEKELAK